MHSRQQSFLASEIELFFGLLKGFARSFQAAMSTSGVQHLSLFPKLTEDVVTGIRVFTSVLNKDREKVEIEIGNIRPDMLDDEFAEQFGDGIYRLEAVASDPQRKSPRTLETRQKTVAFGKSPPWLSKAKAVLANAGQLSAEEEEEEGSEQGRPGADRHGRFMEGRDRHRFGEEGGFPGGPDDMGHGGDPFLSRMAGMGHHGSLGGQGSNGAPVVVPVSRDVSVPVAQGLDPDRQQEILDRARKEVREDTKDMTMMSMMMQMMQQQNESSRREAETLRHALSSKSSERSTPDAESSAAMQAALRREIEDLTDRLRKFRAESDDDMRRMRATMDESDRRYRLRIDDLEKENRDLRAELVSARGDVQKTKIEVEVQKLLASSNLPKDAQPDAAARFAQVKSVIEALAPLAGPLFAQVMGSMAGGAPAAEMGAGMAGGALPGT